MAGTNLVDDTGSSGSVPGAQAQMNEARERHAQELAERNASGAPVAGMSLAELRRAAEEDRRKAEEVEEVVDPNDPYAGMTKKERKAAEKAAKQLAGGFDEYPLLLELKPKEGYVFASDYFQVDKGFATILGFFHDDAAKDDFGAFWGINRIPSGMPAGVSTVVLEQVRRMSEKWVADRIKASERLDKLDQNEQEQTGTNSSRRKAAKIADDVDIITGEIQDGASYMHVHDRLLVKAPSLAVLDEAVELIRRQYIELFSTLRVAAYPGEQRQELSNLWMKNEKKRGKGFHFTSPELAGSHALVTNGLNDPAGEYVGHMTGDVNNSAVLFDANAFEHHVVIADSTVNSKLGRAHVSDMWGSKLSQVALLNNRKVVHINLDNANLDRLGPGFKNITARLDMSQGDINMLEMFGKEEDELSIFPAHLDKLVLMAEQTYETTDSDRSVIRGSLRETLTQFYINNNMWARNAKENRDRLRVVNVAHDHVPTLADLVTYFASGYKRQVNSNANDQEMVHAFSVLKLVFQDMLDNNGHLFNTHTNPEIDSVGTASRIMYDFSSLLRSGKGVAMAQLVNVISFAVDALGLGDLVVIHGAENIDPAVKEYINNQFGHLFNRGGRVAYLYNDVDKMMADHEFNHFDAADYTILGPMRPASVVEYQKLLSQEIPHDLRNLITTKGENMVYLRRGHTNVVFSLSLMLGIGEDRAERRAQIAAANGAPVQSGAVVAAQTRLAEAREKRIAEEGAEAQLVQRMKRDRTRKTLEQGSGVPARRMTRNR